MLTMITSRPILIEMSNISDKSRDNQSTYFMFKSLFIESCALYETTYNSSKTNSDVCIRNMDAERKYNSEIASL